MKAQLDHLQEQQCQKELAHVEHVVQMHSRLDAYTASSEAIPVQMEQN